MMPDALDARAETIAEQVNGKRALLLRNMRGLAREKAHKINNATAHEIASLRSQVKNLRADIKNEPRGASKRARSNVNKNKGSNANKNERKQKKGKNNKPSRDKKIFSAAVTKPQRKFPRPSFTEEPTGQAMLPQTGKETPPKPDRAANPLGRSAPPEQLDIRTSLERRHN